MSTNKAVFRFHKDINAHFIFLQEKLKEKDAQIEEITNLLSKKQDTISKLERDLANSKLELNGKDNKLNDILQLEVL